MKRRPLFVVISVSLLLMYMVYRANFRLSDASGEKACPNVKFSRRWTLSPRTEVSVFKRRETFNTARSWKQYQRKQLVNMFCNRTCHKTLPNPFHIVVIQPLKILYCLTPKVASWEWRKMLYLFTQGPYQIRLSNFTPEKQREMLNTYFKFTFVREPFERLLSAYKDKFLNPRQTDWEWFGIYGRDILKTVRPNASKRAKAELNDITFREFIEYVIKKSGEKVGLDWHWDNYLNICGMCAVDYDFLGHYESFDQDLLDFKKKARLSPGDATAFNLKFSKNRSDTASSMLKYYSQIPLEWIDILGEIYRPSFEMFGYSFPGPLKSLYEKLDEMTL